MYKIREDINLEELKKYGYLQGRDTCEINKETRRIELSRSSKKSFRSFINNDEKLLNKYIDDLIKADLVVKEEN